MSELNQIPTMPFYGDEPEQESLDLLHIEPLITRSRQHRFKIKPHRHHHLTQLFVLESGSGVVRLDGEAHQFQAPCVIVIAAMCVHDFSWSPDINGSVLTCDNSLLQQANPGANNKPIITQLIHQPDNLDQLVKLLQMLAFEHQHPHTPLRDNALINLVSLIITWLARQQQLDTQTDHAKRKQPLLSRYQELIDEHYLAHWQVADYAAALNITAPHLNAICRRHANDNAQQFIHKRLILEAKRNLNYTVLTVNQVSDSLGFQDPGYFNRFFKRHTGQTPKQFRNSQ